MTRSIASPMLMKEDRDANFVETTEDGKKVNRWLTTGMLAASAGQQRSRLPHAQDGAQSRHARVRQPGACLTRPDGGRSCPDVWPWSDDEPLGRHQERGRNSGDGRQCRGSAPVRLQVGDRGQGAPQGASDGGRPAFHAHGIGGGFLRADPHRHGHRVPWRRDQLSAHERQDPARVREELHGLPVHRARGLRIQRRPLLRL